MSDNQLIPVNDALVKFDEAAMDEVAKASAYLPRLQLYSNKSGAVAKGHIGMGCYGLTRAKDDIDDLTSSVDVVVCATRAKALQIDGDTIINNYDQSSDEFKRIAAESDIQDSGCMFGPEFLLWIPSAGQFCTYFMSSKSARRVSKKLFALRGQAATLSSEFVEKGRFSWHAPIITSCSETPSVLPDPKELAEEVEKFANPPANDGPEKVQDEGGRER